MAQLPPALIHSLETCKGFDKSSFEKIHQSGEQVTSVRINPFKLPRKNSKEGPPASDVLAFFKGVTAIPWTKYGFYLDERPSFTFDPYFHAGCYYVQEAVNKRINNKGSTAGHIRSGYRFLISATRSCNTFLASPNNMEVLG